MRTLTSLNDNKRISLPNDHIKEYLYQGYSISEFVELLLSELNFKTSDLFYPSKTVTSFYNNDSIKNFQIRTLRNTTKKEIINIDIIHPNFVSSYCLFSVKAGLLNYHNENYGIDYETFINLLLEDIRKAWSYVRN